MLFALHDLVRQLPAVVLVLVRPVDKILPLGTVKVSHDGRIPLTVEVELCKDAGAGLQRRGSARS